MTEKIEHKVEYQVTVHSEDGSFWAEVDELPGLFVSGDSIDEIFEALPEALALYMNEPGQSELGVKIGKIEQVESKYLVGC